MRVVDDDGAELKGGQVGELQVKGPGVLKAYWGDDAATAAVLTEDGWLRTGDLARKGPLGLLVFEGRQKHVIKHGGYSVYALEVEQVLEQHPDVLEASVVGLPDERLGEVPAAVVRLAEGATLESGRASRRGPTSAWPTTRCRSAGSRSTSSRAPAPSKVQKAELARPLRLRLSRRVVDVVSSLTSTIDLAVLDRRRGTGAGPRRRAGR